jgi:hypothetical protein
LIDFSHLKEIPPQQALQMYPMSQPGKFQQPVFPPQANQLASPMNESSPSAPHAIVPGPGITNSPQAPQYSSPMSSQASQTGATGQNTTPLLTNRQPPSSTPSKMSQGNKRRRGSTVASMAVKEEEEEAVNNPPVKHPKQSPRIGIGRGGAAAGPGGKRLRGES